MPGTSARLSCPPHSRRDSGPIRKLLDLCRQHRALAIIFGLSLLLRLVHLVHHLGTPLAHPEDLTPYTDIAAFATWGKQIAGGDWLGESFYHPYMDWMPAIAPLETFEAWWGGKEIYHQTPLYPYLLGISYLLTGGSSVPLLLLQVLFSAASVLLAYALARQLWDHQAGLCAAALLGLLAPSIVLDAFLLRASLNASLTLLALWLIFRLRQTPTRRLAAACGAVLAAGYLLRPTGLLLLLGTPVCLLLFQSTKSSLKTWLPAYGGAALGCLLPLYLRNLVVGAPLTRLSTRGPETIIQANTIYSDPGFMTTPPPEAYKQLMDEGAGSMTSALSTAIGTWPGGMGDWLWHIGQKLLCVLTDYEYQNNINIYYFYEQFPLLQVLPGFGAIAGLGVAGIVLLLWRGKDRRLLWPCALAFGALVLGCLLGFALGRYRMPLAVLTCIPAGVACAQIWSSARARPLQAPPLALTLGLGLTVSLCSFLVKPSWRIPDGKGFGTALPGYARASYEEVRRLRVQEHLLAANQRIAEGQLHEARTALRAYLDRYEAMVQRLDQVAVARARQDQAAAGWMRSDLLGNFRNVAMALHGLFGSAKDPGQQRRCEAIVRQIEAMTQRPR